MSRPSYLLTLCTILVVCLTILFVYILSVLWLYRELIAAVMLVFLLSSGVVWVAVSARARLVEQVLRLERYRYKEEMPLAAYQQQRRQVRFSPPYEEYDEYDEE